MPPRTSIAAVATLSDFIREGTFENLRQHRWRVKRTNNWAVTVSLTSDVYHSGEASVQINVNDLADDVRVMQAVEVTPQSKYRMSGWIKTENVTVNAESPGMAGACLSIEGQSDCSESLTGTTDWKQVTWEFTTGDTTTITIGCRLGQDSNLCTGTAWFDDLTLEKLEVPQP